MMRAGIYFSLCTSAASTHPRGVVVVDVAIVVVVPVVVVPRDNRSLSLPFLPQPEALDGSMIGDVGFDPLGLATPDNLNR